jgi:uncharacterized membrane protein
MCITTTIIIIIIIIIIITDVKLEMYDLPVITGATGVVTKSLWKTLEALPGKIFDRFTTKDSYIWKTTT